MEFKILGLLVALGCFSSCLGHRDCSVDNFKVKQDFNKYLYAGTWYAVAMKFPHGLFFLDNVRAEFSVDENGKMTATAQGRVLLFGTMGVCDNMVGTFKNTDDPAKFTMTYHDLLGYTEQGPDDIWMVDTDYISYAINYCCRKLNGDNTCQDSYSFVFSRDPNGLTPEAQRLVRRRQEQLCLERQYRVVRYNGFCKSN